jgi:hypothetical protein
MPKRKPASRSTQREKPAPEEQGAESRVERETFSYRGHSIEVVREYTPRNGEGDEECCHRLLIDGQEIDVHETPSGVESSQNIFQEYGSVYELAEAVVRQWGTTPVRAVESGDHHHGGHDHGGHDHGGHDHGGHDHGGSHGHAHH